ncbi:MAG: paraquat-inducible protein A [Meiothermus sp.]|uniref:paraquat-inducible protein A n=1 Tax=Meiothermus sp. TaxID=1955249 RepID=UPI0025DA7248|nr:paraquat-inducible protein A [Meiothermus sp.]MCS7059315.1 paraquat-inducible protein A [Meiothermus sp.]MCS7195142.1 paraquat-inducible protein A [Meiothermus sp.]MCX7740732.1 paraquat-inducible protein A [Meiothermus sp.]MDW8091860.1 paraquat-inducible protein A [Meiothermus sp.]MDW8482135.1 paraquat-inducible protein A [Meiothermus sp.]
MEDLEVICPVCREPNFVPPEDLEELTPEDYLECESCGAYLQILSTDPLEVAVIEDGEEGLFVDCPECGLTFELDSEEEEAVCPECGHRFEPDWAGLEEEEEDY